MVLRIRHIAHVQPHPIHKRGKEKQSQVKWPRKIADSNRGYVCLVFPYNDRQQPWHDFITHTPPTQNPCLPVDFWVVAARAPPDISPTCGEQSESERSSGARTIRGLRWRGEVAEGSIIFGPTVAILF